MMRAAWRRRNLSSPASAPAHPENPAGAYQHRYLPAVERIVPGRSHTGWNSPPFADWADGCLFLSW
jgi:hypothetical protein